ncbi:MAG: cell wall metabolism sensor histidine kinase WalK [Chloroflexi bacterium]|nr:cell wall metabolism sensor histidine kinase WalK [Chloroflexota bacterium]
MPAKLQKIHWRIALPYVALVILATFTLTWHVTGVVRQSQIEDLRVSLVAQARLLGDTVRPSLANPEPAADLDDLAKRYADSLGARVTIIRADGLVVGESLEDRTTMDNHLWRSEVQQAVFGGEGSSVRYSHTVGYDMMYAAAAIREGSEELGFVRLALSLHAIEGRVAQLRRAVVLAGALTAALAALLAIYAARRVARPIRNLTKVADRLAQGDLSARLFPTTRDEVGRLTVSFNLMADQLREKITRLSSEQNRLAAVLEHMADGVLITDEAGVVQLCNPAAARLLGVRAQEALGRSFVQVARHYRIVQIWERSRSSGVEQMEAVERELPESFVQVIATPLLEEGLKGSLVILQDLTEIHRLQTVRQDFVSNVSHELRTPLAALKALVETLRDSALDDPPAASRFLGRMETELDALTQLVQEFLELARIESGRARLQVAPATVTDAVAAPAERLRPQAERAGLYLTLDLPAALPLTKVDLPRVQQVVTNLVHNAIKFTPTGGSVHIWAREAAGFVEVAVRDSGIGVPADDLPRIFERFYKADRARSGGGTGLGLAIAKHIVQAHGGRIWAESVEGQGSTFFFTLPTA